MALAYHSTIICCCHWCKSKPEIFNAYKPFTCFVPITAVFLSCPAVTVFNGVMAMSIAPLIFSPLFLNGFEHYCARYVLLICATVYCNYLGFNWIKQKTVLATFILAQSVFIVTEKHSNNHLATIMHVNLHQLAPPVKNWRIMLEQSFTICKFIYCHKYTP